MIAFLSRPLRGAWIEACLVRTSKSTYAPHVTKIYSPLCMQILNILHIDFHVRSLVFWTYLLSHPARGAWIEVLCIILLQVEPARRTPHGVRGLKSADSSVCLLQHLSHPAGERGLKSKVATCIRTGRRRTPAGVRGLKFVCWPRCMTFSMSHSCGGVWIEAMRSTTSNATPNVAPSMGAWVKVRSSLKRPTDIAVAPYRGAWIKG